MEGRWNPHMAFEYHLYDYMKRRNLHQTAENFSRESAYPLDSMTPPPVNFQEGFLHKWWQTFCEVYLGGTPLYQSRKADSSSADASAKDGLVSSEETQMAVTDQVFQEPSTSQYHREKMTSAVIKFEQIMMGLNQEKQQTVTSAQKLHEGAWSTLSTAPDSSTFFGPIWQQDLMSPGTRMELERMYQEFSRFVCREEQRPQITAPVLPGSPEAEKPERIYQEPPKCVDQEEQQPTISAPHLPAFPDEPEIERIYQEFSTSARQVPHLLGSPEELDRMYKELLEYHEVQQPPVAAPHFPGSPQISARLAGASEASASFHKAPDDTSEVRQHTESTKEASEFQGDPPAAMAGSLRTCSTLKQLECKQK